MCNFCNPNIYPRFRIPVYELISLDITTALFPLPDYSMPVVTMDSETKALYTTDKNYIIIAYCPICGRKL
jgi:hypothetical protein